MIGGTAMAGSQSFTSIFPLQLGSLTLPAYAGLYGLAANRIVSVVLTPIFDGGKLACKADATDAHDYVDEPSPLIAEATRV